MMNNRLYLKVPAVDELDYHRKLLSDADTMSYNKGYGVDGSGCYFLTKEESEAWYLNWMGVSGRYYAYIMTNDYDMPVGDVNIHYDEGYGLHMIGIVIEAKHRGKGYSEEALALLADKAFNEFGLEQIADDFPMDRVAANKAFIKIGFQRKSDTLLILDKKDYETYRHSTK